MGEKSWIHSAKPSISIASIGDTATLFTINQNINPKLMHKTNNCHLGNIKEYFAETGDS